jgi:hypothetical protein
MCTALSIGLAWIEDTSQKDLFLMHCRFRTGLLPCTQRRSGCFQTVSNCIQKTFQIWVPCEAQPQLFFPHPSAKFAREMLPISLVQTNDEGKI